MKRLLKILAVLLVALTPAVFTACGNTLNDIKITANIESGQEVFMYVGEEKEIVYTVSSLPRNISGRLDFSKSSNLISQPIIKFNAQDNKNTFTFTALKKGRLTLEAIATGGKTLTTIINISEKVEDFEINKELVLVRGDALKSKINLNSDLFKFSPKGTNQTQLIFTDQDGNEITELNVESYAQDTNQVKFFVSSPHLDVEKEIYVRVVDQIEGFNFYINDEPLTSVEEQTPDNQASEIFLSFDIKEFSSKQLYAVIEDTDFVYDVHIIKNPYVLVDFGESKKEEVDGQTKFNFNINAFEIGRTEIVFEAFYHDIPKEIYNVKRTFIVEVIEYPSEILLNNLPQNQIDTQILHLGVYRDITLDLNASLFPKHSKFDSVEFSFDTSELGLNQNIFDYIEFKQNGILLQELNLEDFDFNLPIIAKGLEDTQDKEVYLTLKVFYGSQLMEDTAEQYVELKVPFKVKAGASELLVDPSWTDRIIYIDQNTPTDIFRGFYTNEMQAYLDDVTVTALTPESTLRARVEVLEEEPDDERKIKILPLKIYTLNSGETRWRITLANGVNKTFTIIVVPKLSSVALGYDEYNTSKVSFSSYTQPGNSLNFLRLEMSKVSDIYQVKARFNLKYNLDSTLVNNSNFFTITHQDLRADASFDEQTKQLVINNIPTSGLSRQKVILFKVIAPKIENFKLIDPETLPEAEQEGYVFKMPVEIEGFLPLERIAFSNTKLELYSQNELGYYYKTSASKQTKLSFFPEEVGDLFKDVIPNQEGQSDFKIELSSTENSVYDKSTKLLTINDYGVYDLNTDTFTLNIGGDANSFEVFAKITYYGRVYVSSFTVTPKDYISPTRIELSNYTESIYLDPTHPTQVINFHILPNNAVHKDIDVEFQADIGNVANHPISYSVNQDRTSIAVTYNPNLTLEEKNSGWLIIKPRASITQNNIVPNGTLRVRVTVGKGDWANPFKISTAEQLLNIAVQGLDKHYIISNKIDLSHITSFTSLGVFTGSIRGEKLGEISGINIKSISKNYAGLFEEIRTQIDGEGNAVENTGLISNIKFSGSLQVNVKQGASIGLVAGKLSAGATLKNVSVTLLASSVTLETSDAVHIGAVVGKNSGEIVNHVYSKNTVNEEQNTEDEEENAQDEEQNIDIPQNRGLSTLLIMVGSLEITYNHESETPDRSFVGGVVGLNDENGVIKQIFQEQNIKLFNLENYLAFVNIKLTTYGRPDNLTISTGAIAGKNASEIFSENQEDEQGEYTNRDNTNYSDYMKVGGRIEIFQANNIVGGLVGENQSSQSENRLEYIVSRVKLVSKGEGSDKGDAKFGGLFGVNNGGGNIVKNLTLQALEDGISLGEDASMLYSDTFGLVEGEWEESLISIFGYHETERVGVMLTSQFALDNNLKAFTYIGTDKTPVPSTRRELIGFESNQPTKPKSINNYFGDFLVGKVKQQMFTTAEESLVLDKNKTKNRLANQNSSLLMSYLHFYKAKDSNNQEHLNKNGYNYHDLPFYTSGEVYIVSQNTGIVSITNNGQLLVNSTGMAVLQIYSTLNRKVFQTVYVFVTYVANDFSIYHTNVNHVDNRITPGKRDIVVSANSAKTIFPVFTSNSINIGGTYIEVLSSEDYVLENVEDYNGNDVAVEFEKIGNLYVLKAGKQLDDNETGFRIKSRVQVDYYGHTYSAVDSDGKEDYLKNDEESDIEYRFFASYFIGTTSISSNTNNLSIEPLDKFKLEFEIKTDNFSDKLLLTQNKQAPGGMQSGEYFDITLDKVSYNVSINPNFKQQDDFSLIVSLGEQTSKTIVISVDGIEQTIEIDGVVYQNNAWISLAGLNSLDESYQFELQGDVSLTSVLKLEKIKHYLTAQYNMEENPDDYKGEYVFVAESSSDTQAYSQVEAQVTVEVVSQSVGNILVSSFDGSSSEDIAKGKEEYDYVDPLAKNKNHFRVSVFPLQAEYDYLEIRTMRGVNAILTLIDNQGKSIEGAQNITNGLRLSKSLINSMDNGTVYIRYSIEVLNLYNGDMVSFEINAIKDNQIVKSTIKDLTVKFKQDVSIEITSKKANLDGDIYLTRGSTYGFELTANGYRESEVVFYTSLEGLVFVNLASKTITVTSSAVLYPENNIRVSLSVSGRKTVNGEIITSQPQILSLVIVDYLVTPNQDYIPVKGASNKVANVSIGDSFVFEAEFLQGQTIEYSSQIPNIANMVKVFQEQITKQGTWSYQMGVAGPNGMEYPEYGWRPINRQEGVNLAQTQGYFTISVKNNNLVFIPHKIIDVQNAPYKFKFSFTYDYAYGQAVYKDSVVNLVESEFFINVYQMSGIDTPTPIYTTQQFMQMNQSAYYILMEDIVLPYTFQPITTLIGGLDGNGKKIIINTNFAFESLEVNFGIFNTIAQGALIRNLNIEILTNVNITLTKLASVNAYFGVLAGQNLGSISNVSVKSLPNIAVKTVFLQGQNPTINYVAGLVGQNSGYITNSRVSIDLYSSSSVAGFVGINNGKISNSYVDNSLIVNTSVELDNKTAGFVVKNTGQGETGGRITGSYVAGAHQNYSIYANSPAKVIQSSRQVGGFVYENSGYIANSYSNIPITTSSTSAGFVYVNSGIIKLAFSSSQLKEASTGNYGFIFQNTGTLENNYFLQDTDINSTINPSNRYIEGSLNNVYKKEELLQKNKIDFSKRETFNQFIFTAPQELTKGVWFYPRVTKETHFNNPEKSFVIGRPELVAANLLSTSQMEVDFDLTLEDETTGEIVYAYRNVGEHSQGSIYNPIIISTATEFENKILISGSGGINTNSFRLVSDIDYGRDGEISNLYNMVLVGDIEGNDMEIKNFVINTSSSLASAGLFSKIGNGAQQQGAVRNITLKPSYINLPNANSVGVLAGTIDGGTVFNINVDGRSGSATIMLVGKNLVGGLFGRAENNYYINTVKSTISAHSTYRSPKVLGEMIDQGDKIGSYFLFRTHPLSVISKLSYAGGVVGVLAGRGSVENIIVEGGFSTNAEWSALMFGGVGNAVAVNNVTARLSPNQAVQGAVYAAVVAAEFYGRINLVNITSEEEIKDLFKTNIYKPYAIGGVIGLMGTIGNIPSGQIVVAEDFVAGLYNVNVNLSIITPNVKIVGGVVGKMLSGNIKHVNFVGSVQAQEIAGGIVGRITEEKMEDIELSGQTLSSSPLIDGEIGASINSARVSGGSVRVDNDNVRSGVAGGIVGQVYVTGQSQEFEFVQIENSISSNEIRVISIVYGTAFDRAYAGGVIGQVLKEKIDETGKVTIGLKNVKFESRIVMILRDLNLIDLHGVEDYPNKIGFGYIVGGVNGVELETVGENIKYSERKEPNYLQGGQGILDKQDYLLFNYNYLGVSYSHDPDNPYPIEKDKFNIFAKNVVNGESQISA